MSKKRAKTVLEYFKLRKNQDAWKQIKALEKMLLSNLIDPQTFNRLIDSKVQEYVDEELKAAVPLRSDLDIVYDDLKKLCFLLNSSDDDKKDEIRSFLTALDKKHRFDDGETYKEMMAETSSFKSPMDFMML